jgi:putative effector of murein hydrolase
MERALLAIWTPLAPTPLLWLAVTLLAYIAGQMIRRLCRGSPLANPVLIAIIIMAALLVGTGTPYTTYFAGAQFINFLLGPATVALAVPLARNLAHVRRSFRGVGLALLAGSVTSAVSGVVVVWALGGGQAVALAMAPKAVTTPIAMALSQEIGGAPALTAALAIAGGIVAAVIGQTMLRWLRITDWRAHGFAAGVGGSGVAAAQVAPLDGLAAAFAALGISLNGLLTAVLVPLLVPFIGWLWAVG